MFLSESLKRDAHATILERQSMPWAGAVPIRETPMHLCPLDMYREKYKPGRCMDLLGVITGSDGIEYAIGSLRT